MALPPGGIGDTPDGDRKRLLQRADSFAIGTGTRNKKELDEIEEFDEALESVLHKSKKTGPEPEEDQAKQLERHREEKAQLEAERRGSSSPSHQPFLGMSVLPGISNPGMAVSSTPESHSKRRSGGVAGTGDARVEAVSPEIVQGLRAAGLREPVVTLDAPRLSGSAQAMHEHFVFSLRGTERVYVWDQNGCHQIVAIGLHGSSLESAVGATVETLTRRGKIDEKTTSQRKPPSTRFEA